MSYLFLIYLFSCFACPTLNLFLIIRIGDSVTSPFAMSLPVIALMYTLKSLPD